MTVTFLPKPGEKEEQGASLRTHGSLPLASRSNR